MEVIDAPCPWHASDPAQPSDIHRDLVIVGYLNGGPAFYARQATDDDIALGWHLTRELAKIAQLVGNDDAEAILAEIPSAYRTWLDTNGYDPADAWIRQRLTDLILNRGESTLPGLDHPAT